MICSVDFGPGDHEIVAVLLRVQILVERAYKSVHRSTSDACEQLATYNSLVHYPSRASSSKLLATEAEQK